jgi:hypothetical protein
MLADFTKMAEDHVSTNVKLIDGSANDETVRCLLLLRYCCCSVIQKFIAGSPQTSQHIRALILGAEVMQSAMMKIQGTENGLVTLVYDVVNTGETVPTTRRGEVKDGPDVVSPPFRADHCNRLVGLFLQCRNFLQQQCIIDSSQ